MTAYTYIVYQCNSGNLTWIKLTLLFLQCKVIKFAIVTKHPRCKSAFTYCEDELPSRIDFGKSKYGGPFTTEQVEDVKTLLRLLPLILIFGVTASVLAAANILYIYLDKQYNRFTELNVVREL